MVVTLNINFQGRSIDYPVDVFYEVSIYDLKKIAFDGLKEKAKIFGLDANQINWEEFSKYTISRSKQRKDYYIIYRRAV